MNFTINQTNGIRETVNSEFINKLYNLFITNRSSHTISLSGYLYSPTGYKALMDALNQLYGPDLVIEVPAAGLYILFHDPEVTNVLKTSIGDGEGINQSNIESVTSTSLLGLANNTSITDFREGCLFTGITNASTSFVSGCTNLDVLGIPPNINYFSSGMLGNSSITKVIIKNWLNWTNIRDIQGYNAFLSGYQFYDLNQDGTISIINHLILPEGCNIPLDVNMDRCIIFKNSGLQEVTLPTSMTYVGAFEGSSLKYLHFANGALPTLILSRAFNGCSSLEFNVSNLPTSITTLGWRCFYNCSKITGSLNLHNLIRIDGESFRGSGITGITDLGSITSIPNNCFHSCKSLTSVTLPSTCTSVGLEAFAQSSVTGHVDLTNMTSIGSQAFFGSGITSITIPNNLLSRDICNIYRACPDLTTINANYETSTVNPYFGGTPSLIPFVIYQPLVTSLSGPFFGNEWTSTYKLASGNKNPVSNWTHLYYPNITTTVCSYCYYNNNGDNYSTFIASLYGPNIDLVYVKNVSSLDKHTFPKGNSRIGAFVINNTTVPKIIEHERNGLTTLTEIYAFSGWDGNLNGYSSPAGNGIAAKYHMIYVPDFSVQDYKTAWPILADHIYSIHDLNNGIIYATEVDWTAAGKPAGLIAEYLGLNTADLATFVSANNLTYWTNPNA